MHPNFRDVEMMKMFILEPVKCGTSNADVLLICGDYNVIFKLFLNSAATVSVFKSVCFLRILILKLQGRIGYRPKGYLLQNSMCFDANAITWF